MTYRQIETSREIRLWVGQIIVPTMTLATTIILTNPEYRVKAAEAIINIGDSIKSKFKKKRAVSHKRCLP